MEDEAEVVSTIVIIRLRHHPHRISRKDGGAAAIGTKTTVAAAGKILESPPREEGLREKNVGSRADDGARTSSLRSRVHHGNVMTITEVGTEIRGIAFSEGMSSTIVVRVVEIRLRWEEVLRLGVDAIAVPCSTQISVAEVILVAAVAVVIVTVLMVLRSAVVSDAAVEVVVHMIAVAAAGVVVVGGFPTRKAEAFTVIER